LKRDSIAASTGDLGAQDRLDAAFAREERRGLMVAAAARSASVVFILGWLAVANPERGLAYAWVLGSAAFFLVTGLAQLWLYFRGQALRLAAYLFEREAADLALLHGLTTRGPSVLRGRDTPIELWAE
jgi:hypothetical protein